MAELGPKAGFSFSSIQLLCAISRGLGRRQIANGEMPARDSVRLGETMPLPLGSALVP